MKRLRIVLLFIIFSTVSITICFAQAELEIPQDSLPKEIKEQCHQKHHHYSMVNAIKKTDKAGVVIYLLKIQREVNSSKTIVVSLVYDKNGKIMSKKKEKEFYYTGKEKSTPKPSGGQEGGHQH